MENTTKQAESARAVSVTPLIDGTEAEQLSPATVETAATDNADKGKVIAKYSKDEYRSMARQLQNTRDEIADTKNKIETLRSELERGFIYKDTTETTPSGRSKRRKVNLNNIMIDQREHQIHDLQIQLANFKSEEQNLRKHYSLVDRSIRYYDKLDMQVIRTSVKAEHAEKKFIENVRVKLFDASKNGHAIILSELKTLAATKPYEARQKLNNLLQQIDHKIYEVLKAKKTLRNKLFDQIFGEVSEEMRIKNRENNLQVEDSPEVY